MFHPLPSNYGETMNLKEPRKMSLPWWALGGNVPLSLLHQQNLGSRHFINQPCSEALNHKLTVSSKCTENGDDVAAKDDTALSSQRAGSDRARQGVCNPVKDVLL